MTFNILPDDVLLYMINLFPFEVSEQLAESNVSARFTRLFHQRCAKLIMSSRLRNQLDKYRQFIQVLDATFSNIERTDLVALICSLPSLKKLYAHAANLSVNDLPAILKQCSELRYVSLSPNTLPTEKWYTFPLNRVACLSDRVNYWKRQVYGCYTHDNDSHTWRFPKFDTCPKLHQLNLSWANYDISCVSLLICQLKKLVVLSLSCIINEDAMRQIIDGCHQLRVLHLDLTYSPHTGERFPLSSIVASVSPAKKLQEFRLAWRNYPDVSLEEIFTRITCLTTLEKLAIINIGPWRAINPNSKNFIYMTSDHLSQCIDRLKHLVALYVITKKNGLHPSIHKPFKSLAATRPSFWYHIGNTCPEDFPASHTTLIRSYDCA